MRTIDGQLSVAILMGTYNGARYLRDQLDSIAKQTHTNWKLIVSDDGSTDDTLDVLKTYQSSWAAGKLEIRNGPRGGFCQNFLSLACDPQVRAHYYAFCDQDDSWLPNKVSVALDVMSANEKPALAYLYCGRTIYTDEALNPLDISPHFKRPTSFANALVQSIAGGNTMVFNNDAKSLLEKAGVLPVVSHDWWMYQLTTGAGGEVYYDSNAYLLYRQHDFSLVGGNTSIKAKFTRLLMVFDGRFKRWNTQNISAMQSVRYLLTPSACQLIDTFERSRGSSLVQRLRLLSLGIVYRQSWAETLSLLVSNLFKKV